MSITSWIPIDSISVGDRRRKELGDLDKLAESIKELGVIEPLVVTADRRLLAGKRRLEAARRAGLRDVPVFVKEADDELTARRIEQDENDLRKAFTLSERHEAAEGIRKLIETGEREVPKGADKREYIAGVAGFDSVTTMRRVAAVVEEGAPELVEAVDKGEVTPGAAVDLLTLPKKEQAEAVKTGKAKATAAKVRKDKPPAKKKAKPEPVSQANDEADGDTELMDGLGNPVPNAVADAFGDPALRNLIVDVFDHGASLKALLGRVQSVARKSHAWPFARFGEAMKAIANGMDDIVEAHSQLANGVPYAVCPKCGGNGCLACVQAGYVTRHMHENADQYGG